MTGNPSLDKIILGINGLFVTLAAALVFYSHNMIQRPLTDEGEHMKKLVEDSLAKSELAPVTFPKMVVNLYSRQTRLRYLDTQLNIEVFEASDKADIERFKPFILDSLIDISGNMKPDELNSITGRILLETRLKNSINDKIGRNIVRKIYFSRFIIQ